MRRSLSKNLVFSILTVFLLSSCSIEIKPPELNNDDVFETPILETKNEKDIVFQDEKEFVKNQEKMNSFESYEELKSFLAKQELDKVNISYDYNYSSEKDIYNYNSEGVQIYDENIIKGLGVNDVDIIKSDNEYLYVLSQNKIYLIRAYPAEEASILSIIDLKNAPIGFFVYENKLLVFGESFDFYNENKHLFKRNSTYSYLKIFDVSNRANPLEDKQIDYEGKYLDSRISNGKYYLESVIYDYTYYQTEEVLPRYFVNNEEYAECGDEECSSEAVHYFELPYDKIDFFSLYTIDLSGVNKIIDREHFLLSDNFSTFFSDSNFYIAYNKNLDQSQLEIEVMNKLLLTDLSEVAAKKVKEIYRVKDYVLNKYEKEEKIKNIFNDYIFSLSMEEQIAIYSEIETELASRLAKIKEDLDTSVIHKCSLGAKGLEYISTAVIPGEFVGAPTTSEISGVLYTITYDLENSNYTILALDKNFKELNRVEGLYSGETISLVSFMQNKMFVKLESKPSSLYVIDLNLANEMKDLGEITYFSQLEYLHPYDNNILIGVNRGGATGEGINIYLYDVTDVVSPKLIDSFTMGGAGSNSLLMSNPRSFYFSRPKNLVFFPVEIRNSSDDLFPEANYTGAVVLNTSRSGFSLKGVIDHSGSTIKRGIFANNTLYSFSDQGIKVNSLSSLNELSFIKY